MEKVTYSLENQVQIERFLLVVYSFYSFLILLKVMDKPYGGWAGCVLLLLVMSCWILNVGRVGSYAFRAFFTTVMMQITLLVHTFYMNDFARVLPIFIAFVIFVGVYGIADLIRLMTVSVFVIFMLYYIVRGNLSIYTTGDTLLHLGNVLLVEYVMYVWTKRNSEGSRRLLDAIKELKTIESSKDDFVANVSHEIRTPINTICGMSDIILREEMSLDMREKVQDIQRAGRDLMGVVSDILDFSELQSGEIELEEEAYNITSTINDIINMTTAWKKEKDIELILDCDPTIPCGLLGDEKKIRRVVMNVVENAIKFTEAGGVFISVSYRKESYGINLSVTVKDTGIGMDERSLEKIFTTFSQADSSRKRQEGGMGLGLAISHALVLKMGGAITVKSRLGRGTVVKITVPQRILDEKPIVALENRNKILVATYIDMEQFAMEAIRDEYTSYIVNMVEKLKGRCFICRSMAELQRRVATHTLSHVFTSIVEYRENKDFFDELSKEIKVIVVLERADDKDITNPNLLKIYKPFYILSVVAALNGSERVEKGEVLPVSSGKMVTRDTKLLVVDDNHMNLRVIEGILSNYDIEVVTANSGADALEKITTCDYDFVFMDHMMPEMDGVETLQQIRHKVGTYYQSVPVVALTANAVAGAREMLLSEGFDDFLEKPVERSVLERVLKRNLIPEKIYYKTESEVAAGVVADAVQIAEPRQEDWQSILIDMGLDVQKGILYCNGAEAYQTILRGYCEDYSDFGEMARKQFASKDWKNYTITVHGIKSAMGSIGAGKVSELALGLELAGKEGRIDYILEHHQEMLDAYEALFDSLREKFGYTTEKKDDAEELADKEELPDISKEEFEAKFADLEEAMFGFDEKQMLAIIEEFQKYSYCGESLNRALTPVKRKVEMADYMSAVDMVTRIKQDLESKES